MVSTLIDRRNDVNMFKTQVEWQVISLQIFEHFDVDKKYRPWKIVAKLFFCHNIDRFDAHLVEVSQETCMREREKQITAPSHHFHGLYFYQT